MTFKRFGIIALMGFLSFAVLLSACGDDSRQKGAPVEGEINPMYHQQEQMLEDALKADPNNFNILVQLGNLYYDWGQEEVNKKGDMAEPVGKWTKAVDYYKRALVINPADVNVRVDMANLLRFMGRGDEAIAEYRQAKNIDPKHPQARINLILALGEMKQDYKGALSEYDALIKAVPDQAQNLDLKQEVAHYKDLMKGGGK